LTIDKLITIRVTDSVDCSLCQAAYEARTRPDPGRVRVGHVSGTETCPTRP